MKNTRKILILLLLIAMSFACFSVFAYAAEATPSEDQLKYEAALATHKKVLEYYEAGYYLNADFDDAADFNAALSDATDEFALTVGGAFEATLADGAANVSSVSNTYFDFVPDTVASFGIKAKVKVTADSSFSLFLHSSKRGSVGEYLRLFAVSGSKIAHELDYKGDTISYKTSTSAVAADTYFDIDFFLDKQANQNVITLIVTPDNGVAETFTYSYDNTSTDFLNGKFDFKSFYLATDGATIDSLQVYKGSFMRDLDNGNNVKIIADAIVAIANDYNTYSTKVDSKAYELCEIVADLVVTYGYDPSGLTDTALVESVKTFAQTCVNTVAPVYAEAYANGVNNINVELAYYDRLTHVESIAVYSDFLNNLKDSDYSEVDGIDYDAIAADSAKVEAELATLEKAKEDTIAAFAAAVNIPNVYLATYADYREAYDVLKAHPICATYYDEQRSAEAVNLASKVANVILAEYPVIDKKASAFAENVVIANDQTKSYAERYAAYTIAKANVFTDASYDAYLDGTTVAELLAAYDNATLTFSASVEAAEAFLSKIDQAAKTPSYSVKLVALDEAAAYIDTVERGYPGVTEAIELYNALRKDISDKIEATKLYIQSVIDVQNAATVAEKKAAIAKAKELAVLGNDVSVEIADFDITVTQANVILSDEESAIVLAETKVANFIAATNALDSITDRKALKAAIARASALKAGADVTAAGVADASAKLDAAIAAFNAAVNAANTAGKETATLTVSVLGASVPTQRIGEVIAIIKKFYE